MKRAHTYSASGVVVKHMAVAGHEGSRWLIILAHSSSEVSPLYLPFLTKRELHDFLFAWPGVREEELKQVVGAMTVSITKEHTIGYVVRVPGCIVFVNPNLVQAALRLVGDLSEA